MPSETNAAIDVDDPMDRLGHMLIRAHNGDQFDPFFVHGHPDLAPTETRVVRACFYYSVVMSPKIIVLWDNFGKGGMTSLGPEQIARVWSTPDVTAALGTTFENLRDGTAVLAEGAIPSPLWTPPDDWCRERPEEDEEAAPSP